MHGGQAVDGGHACVGVPAVAEDGDAAVAPRRAVAVVAGVAGGDGVRRVHGNKRRRNWFDSAAQRIPVKIERKGLITFEFDISSGEE